MYEIYICDTILLLLFVIFCYVNFIQRIFGRTFLCLHSALDKYSDSDILLAKVPHKVSLRYRGITEPLDGLRLSSSPGTGGRRWGCNPARSALSGSTLSSPCSLSHI